MSASLGEGSETMNLDALVRRDRQPWEPCPEASALDEWHHYDVPLMGTFRVGAATVMFVAMGDASGDTSIWAYAELTDAESSEAAEAAFDSTEDMQTAAGRYFNGKEAVIALASDLRIRQWGRVQVQDGLLEATSQFLDMLLAELKGRQGMQTATSVKRAQIEAAAKELVG